MERKSFGIMFCRICRTTENLKYNLQELQSISEQFDHDSEDVLRGTFAIQTGNICIDCERHLLNFDALTNESDMDLGSDGCGHEEYPIIVDDDVRLFNTFLKKKDFIRKNSVPDENGPREFTQHSLGSDGDTEIIEVLTSSRESTPSKDSAEANFVPGSEVSLAASAMEFIAVNAKDNERDGGKTKERHAFELTEMKKYTAATANNTPSDRNFRRSRRFSDRQIKLVASMSLISSDSEYEFEQTIEEPNSKLFPCCTCGLNFLNVGAMQRHQFTHNYAHCPVCGVSFMNRQRLVQHMRTKHRSYSGDVLSERPKCPQDSAMTIRLRYLYQDIYYECQLCGQIDAAFKDHKNHIVTQHAAESKSLKDPMMKELKCPICKRKCGLQYVTLCKHLRQEHKNAHMQHLRRVPHVHSAGMNAERQREVETTSTVFQFPTRKTRYYECNICQKFTSGYFNHYKHLSVHASLHSYEDQAALQPIGYVGIASKTTTDDNKGERSKANMDGVLQPNEHSGAETNKLDFNRQKNKQNNGVRMNAKNIKSSLGLFKAKKKFASKPQSHKFTCHLCSAKLRGYLDFNRHLMEKHCESELHRCHKCDNVFFSMPKLMKHLSTQHTGGQCDLCQREIDDMKSHHRRVHHNHKFRIFNGFAKENQTGKDILLTTFGNSADQRDETDDACSSGVVSETTRSGADYLQELSQFCGQSTINEAATKRAYQCRHCTCLFLDSHTLSFHQNEHAKDDQVHIMLWPSVKTLTCLEQRQLTPIE